MRRAVLLLAMVGLLALLPTAGPAACIDYEDYLHFQHAERLTNSNLVYSMDRHNDLMAISRHSGGLEIYDVGDPYAPEFLGDATVTYSALDCMWCPPYIFVTDTGNYVLTVYADDPTNPYVWGALGTSGYPYSLTRTRSVLIVGTEFGLDLMRYGDPQYPTLIDTVATPGPVLDVAVGLEDQYAFCAMGNAGLGIVSVDTTAGSPIVAVVPTSNEFEKVLVRGNYAFVTEVDWYDAWLSVYDVGTPSSPSFVTSVELNRVPTDIAYAHERFWLPNDQGMDVVSVASGYVNAELERHLWTYGEGQTVSVGPSTVYVGTREHDTESLWAGIECFELGNLEMVEPAASAPVSVPIDITGMGPYALVTAWSSSLHVFDCTTNTFVAGEYIDTEPTCVAVNGSEAAIVTTYWEKAYHVDMSDPLDPVRGAVGDSYFSSFGLDCRDGRAYVAANWDGVRVLDVSSPDTISTVCQTDIDDAKVRTVQAADGGYCYAAGSDSEGDDVALWVFDTSDPDTAVVVGEWLDAGGGYANGVTVAGDVAYMCGRGRLYILDVSNPLAPVTVGSTRVPGKMWDVAVGEGYAYLAGEYGGFFVVDVGDPSDPRIVGQYCGPGLYDGAMGLCAWGENIYVLGNGDVFVLGRHCADDTGVTSPGTAEPSGARLVCAPNPFTRQAEIAFELPEPGRVQLALYDVAGRLVSEVVDGWRPAGRFSATWDGRDASGREVATGVYFARLTAGEETVTGKVVVVR